MVMVYGFLSNQDFSVKGMVKSMCIGYRQGALLKSPRVNEGSKHRNTILDRIPLAAQYRGEGSLLYRPPPHPSLGGESLFRDSSTEWYLI